MERPLLLVLARGPSPQVLGKDSDRTCVPAGWGGAILLSGFASRACASSRTWEGPRRYLHRRAGGHLLPAAVFQQQWPHCHAAPGRAAAGVCALWWRLGLRLVRERVSSSVRLEDRKAVLPQDATARFLGELTVHERDLIGNFPGSWTPAP